MRTFILLVSLAVAANAATIAPVITVDSRVFAARGITNAASTTVTGPLINGGLGETPGPWAGKVVLIDRGTNTFAAKVKNAETAGAIGVIVANNNADPLGGVTLAPDTSTIPAVFVTQADGAALKALEGAPARVGEVMPHVIVPDPKDNAGKSIVSDGKRYVLQGTAPTVATNSEVAAGSPITMTVSADGPAPHTYQWIKDGQNISGATTAVFSIASASAADAGSYVCQVSNPFGAAPSAPQRITVK
jgi:hypothetical protein